MFLLIILQIDNKYNFTMGCLLVASKIQLENTSCLLTTIDYRRSPAKAKQFLSHLPSLVGNSDTKFVKAV